MSFASICIVAVLAWPVGILFGFWIGDKRHE
jgi:uncharacterized protein YneF (UPF0154 family)